jgi:hypothetical protein
MKKMIYYTYKRTAIQTHCWMSCLPKDGSIILLADNNIPIKDAFERFSKKRAYTFKILSELL